MNKTKRIGYGALAILLALVFLMGAITQDPYILHVATIACVNIILALSLWLVFSAGELNLAVCGFMAIGAYGSSLLVMRLGWSFWFTLFVAGLLCAFVSLLIGILALRLKGAYFFIVTLAFAEIINLIFSGFWVDVFGSQTGIIGVPSPDPINLLGLTINFTSKTANYYLGLIMMLLSVLFFRALSQSRFGRTSKAIAQSDALARTVGVDVMRHKVNAFIIAGFFAGLAGSFYAHFIHVVTPWDYGTHYTILIVAAMIVGGSATIAGPVIGAIFFTILGLILRDLAYLEVFITGLILVICIRFLPRGLISLPEVFKRPTINKS